MWLKRGTDVIKFTLRERSQNAIKIVTILNPETCPVVLLDVEMTSFNFVKVGLIT